MGSVSWENNLPPIVPPLRILIEKYQPETEMFNSSRLTTELISLSARRNETRGVVLAILVAECRCCYFVASTCFAILNLIVLSEFTTADEADENSLLLPRAISSLTF
jgi:hypothetical protein